MICCFFCKNFFQNQLIENVSGKMTLRFTKTKRNFHVTTITDHSEEQLYNLSMEVATGW